MFSGLSRFRVRQHETPVLRAIYITGSAGEPMSSVDSVEAIQACGLQGDRYCAQTGYWKPIESCEVTLITEHELRQAQKGVSPQIRQNLQAGSHRRNLVIAGMKVKQLEGQYFSIGSAVFRYQKPRPPCGYIDQVSGRGTCRALAYYSGICIQVVTGGVLSVGDPVRPCARP